MASYLSAKVRLGPSKVSGKGLIAIQPISKDEVVIDFSGGIGRFVNKKTENELWAKGIDFDIQVDDDLFFVGNDNEIEDVDFLNHSCNPNCGIRRRLKIVAMRDIIPGEEITFDYAMSESDHYEIDCNCRSENCRKKITGNDWKKKELQQRYNGYFSDYLQAKIIGLR